MEQGEAIRSAKELGGIAIGARWRGDHWLLGGWPNQKDETWIVISIDRTKVLDDGGVWPDGPWTNDVETPDLPDDGTYSADKVAKNWD